VQTPVGGNRRILGEVAISESIGVESTCFLDHDLNRCIVVWGKADGIDCNIDRSFCDEHVLPEVTESPCSVAPLLKCHEIRGQTEIIPTFVEGDADLRLTDV
jgi:hypothetical protein